MTAAEKMKQAQEKFQMLQRKKTDFEKQYEKDKEAALNEMEAAVSMKITSLTSEQKTLLLSMLEHDRTSCSDENQCNGYSYSSKHWRCRKCMLMEILRGEHGGTFDFKITVDIHEVGT